MCPIGSRGHIAYLKEATFGVVAEPATKVWTMNNEAIIQNIEEILSLAHRRVVDEPHSYQGLRTFGGPVELEVHPDNFGDILRSAIWDPATGAAARKVVVLEDCEDNWVSDGGCISELDLGDYKTGSGSVKITVPADVIAGVIIATETFGAGIDMEDDDEIVLWMKSSINLAANQLKFVIDEEAACAGPDESIMIDTNLVAGVWKEVTIGLPAMAGYTLVLSIGIELEVEQVEFTLHLDNIRRVDTAGVAIATAHDHVFTPKQTDFHADCPLYPYTIEVHRDQAVAQAWQFLGAVVNTLNLKWGVDQKILTATAGILAQNVDRVLRTEVAFPTTSPFVWSQAVVYIGGVAGGDITKILESFDITIDNKLVGIPSLDGNVYIRRFYRGGPREVTVNFVTDFIDQAEYDLFVLGSEQELQIVFTGAPIVGDLTFDNTFTLYFPKFRYSTYPISNPGSGRISVGVTGKAKYCATKEYSHVFTLRNATDDY